LAADYLELFFSLRSLSTSCGGLESNLEARWSTEACKNHFDHRCHWLAEHGDPARNDMPSGLLAMEIQSDVRCVALAIRRANKRLNRIYLLQLPTAQLDLSLFSNTAMLLTAIVGEIIYVSNR
jgi:hypothetical protein